VDGGRLRAGAGRRPCYNTYQGIHRSGRRSNDIGSWVNIAIIVLVVIVLIVTIARRSSGGGGGGGG
jgi:hypothetical protein